MSASPPLRLLVRCWIVSFQGSVSSSYDPGRVREEERGLHQLSARRRAASPGNVITSANLPFQPASGIPWRTAGN
ncbi:hypothetical protein NQZ68_005130 [Dissostichus eleginoides]|nr:hypothetical protein NQZ68_005130 [Dissostichus eleginoides]